MDKSFINSAIKRTTEENGGVGLGHVKFATETGIKYADWYGKHWARWGDALREAGYAANELQAAYDQSYLIEKLCVLIRELGRFPVKGELRLKARQDPSFPESATFHSRLGNKKERVSLVKDYCEAKG